MTTLAEKIRAVPRRTHTYEVQGMFALGHEVAQIAIRVPTKREQNDALDAAHAAIAKRAERAPGIANDPDILEDAKAEHIVAACCFDPTSPDMMQVWPSGEVVKEDLTADQIGVLVRLINEVRAKFGPTPETIDDGKVEAFATMAAAAAETNAPDSILSPLPHTYLVQLYILTAIKLQAARAGLEAAEASP